MLTSGSSAKMTTVETNRKYKPKDEGAKDWPQILAILIGCISAVSSGLFLAWSSPFIVKITRDKLNYDITEDEASVFAVLNNVGLTVFSPFFTIFNLPDIIGRKRTLMLTIIPYEAAWLMKAYSTNLYVLYIARFIIGIGDALLFAALPSYVGEISTPKVRGLWGNAVICSLYLGQLLINVIGVYCTVQQASFIGLCIPVIFIVLFFMMPESPYFYAMKGRDEEAKRALRRLRGTAEVEEEFIALKTAVERQMSEAGTWKDLVGIVSNRKALIAALFLRISQVYAGVYVFASYTQFIFEKSGGNVSPEVASIIYVGLSFILFVSASYFSDKFGRRKSYMISMLLCAFMLILEGAYFYLDDHIRTVDLSVIRWFPLAGMIVFLLFSSFGVSIIPTLMMGELFAASIKSKGVGVVTTLFGLMVFLANYIFYLINSYTGLCGPFFLFGCCSIVSVVLAYFTVPETKGKSLEEIQLAFKGDIID